MKKSVLIKIICLLIIISVSAIGTILAISFANGLFKDKDALVISSGTSAAVYNGEELTNNSWKLLSGELLEGDELSVTVSGTQTEVGVSENYLIAKVYDKNGNDVTHDYTLEYEPGTLTVQPRSITVTADSAQKEYDGTPLSSSGFKVESALPMVEGHTVEARVEGSITEEGVADNVIKDVKVIDKTGKDVTRNYDINTIPGQLIVGDGSDGSGEGGSGGAGGGGTGGSGEGGSGEGGLNMGGNLGDECGNDEEVYFILQGLEKDTVYLRMKSFGNFDGKNTWSEPTMYSVLTDDMLSAYYITSLALDNSGLSPTLLSINPVGGVFALPYYSLNGEFQTQMSDVLQEGDASVRYNVNYFNWDSVSGIVLPKRYREYEEVYRKYVYENYLDIDSVTLNYMLGIIAERGFSATAPDIISKVTSYIKSSAKYNLQYNPEMDNSDNSIIAFLSDYKEGVCRHYASAAVLMFRALGIPARYTIGFLGSVEAGKETTVTGMNYHAWAEVYVDGIGWVNVEVTPSSGGAGGIGGNQPTRLEIAPVYTGDYYDSSKYNESSPLLPKNEVTGFNLLAKEGYTYTAEISGEISQLGVAKTEVVDFKIYDVLGELVYDMATGKGSDNFVIEYKTGRIQLYYSVLKFSSTGFEKVYDGVKYEVNESNCTFDSGELMEGYTYKIHSGASVLNAERASASFAVTVYDESGTNRNDYYSIVYDFGEIIINAREISVKAADAVKAYDGEELVCNEIVYDSSELADGDYIESYIVNGSQTNVGKSSNVIKAVIIKNKNGEEVTSNYILKTEEGTLSVTIP